MQTRRLERLGERQAPVSRVNPLDALPDYEKQNWLDMADAVGSLPEPEFSDMSSAAKLRRLTEDWERYGEILAKDPEHRDSMRRAVVVEMRVLLDELWNEADGE